MCSNDSLEKNSSKRFGSPSISVILTVENTAPLHPAWVCSASRFPLLKGIRSAMHSTGMQAQLEQFACGHRLRLRTDNCRDLMTPQTWSHLRARSAAFGVVFSESDEFSNGILLARRQ